LRNNTTITLFLFSLIIYVGIVLTYDVWFIGDEGYYAVSIYEAIKNGPNLYITFLGKPAFWKPFLMVDVYSLMIRLWDGFLPAQISYRIPSAIFSAINVILVYCIAREFSDEKKALLASLLYMSNPIILLFGTKIFMETFTMVFVLGGLLAVIRLCKQGKNNDKLIAYLAILISIVGAAFSKSTTIGIMAMLLYLLYAFFADKKRILGIIAVSGVAAAIILTVPFLTTFPEAYFKLYLEDFFTKRMSMDVGLTNLITMLASLFYLIPLFIMGIKSIDLKSWKDLFLLLWILPLIVIAIKTPYMWYAFYFIAPLVILSLKGVSLNVIDLSIIIVLLLIGPAIMMHSNWAYERDAEIKTIEFMKQEISTNSCTLYVSAISPMVYAFLEIYGYNHNIAITNILWRNGSNVILDANVTNEQLESLVADYRNSATVDDISTREYLFTEWNALNKMILIKTNNYNCTDFEYVAITDYYKKYGLNSLGYTIANENEQIRVWKKRVAD